MSSAKRPSSSMSSGGYAASPSSYEKMPKSQLKALCRSRGLLVGGNMETLVSRLRAYDSGDSEAGGSSSSYAKRAKSSPKTKRASGSSSKSSPSKGAVNPFESLIGGAGPSPGLSAGAAAGSIRGVSSGKAGGGSAAAISSSSSSSSTLRKSSSGSMSNLSQAAMLKSRSMDRRLSGSAGVSSAAPPVVRPKPRPMSVPEVEHALKRLGLKPGSRCVMAGIGRGFINILTSSGFSRNDVVNQVVYEGPCSCGSTMDLKVRLKQALRQSDWGGDGDEECAIIAGRCLCSNYLSGICVGTPSFTSGKFHNHCVDCDGYGVCLGDYRYTHCARCKSHPWRGNCVCRDRLLGEVPMMPLTSPSVRTPRGAVTPRPSWSAAGSSASASAAHSRNRAARPASASSSTPSAPVTAPKSAWAGATASASVPNGISNSSIPRGARAPTAASYGSLDFGNFR